MSFAQNIKNIIGKEEVSLKPLEEMLDFEREESEILDELITDLSHFPTQEVGDFFKLKCQKQLEEGKVKEAAYSLLHSQALAFRHQVISQYSRRIRKREELILRQKKNQNNNNDSDDLFDADKDEEVRTDELQKTSLGLQASAAGDNSKLDDIISKLPNDWRIVQISVQPEIISRFKKTPQDEAILDSNLTLILSMFQCGEKNPSVLVRKVESLENSGRSTIMKEFQNIITSHRMVYQKTEDFSKAKYEKDRNDLDDRLLSLLTTIENLWLGLAKILLLGKPKSNERVKEIEQRISYIEKELKLKVLKQNEDNKRTLLFSLLDGSAILTREQIAQGCLEITDKKAVLTKLVKIIAEFGENNPMTSDDSERCPVVLVLDKEIQSLPWESLPNFRKNPFSRVPSVFFLSALYDTHELSKSSVLKTGVKSDNVYYVLNPDKNLENTQKRLEKIFKGSLGKGVTGQWPSSNEMVSALSENDAFIYCGHGVRQRNITSQELEKLRIRGVVLLFGCNSGKLERMGRNFDPIGHASSYLMATAPCMLGFLWSVTDKDLDLWTLGFLEFWLGKDEKEPVESDFVRAVAKKREDFDRMLNSAATVVYGLPSYLEKEL